MTDSEKLDLLLEKVTTLDNKVNSLDTKVTSLEKDIVDIKADICQLHRNDALILDEVERIHTILDRHKDDKSVHSA